MFHERRVMFYKWPLINPKHAMRNSKQTQMTKIQMTKTALAQRPIEIDI